MIKRIRSVPSGDGRARGAIAPEGAPAEVSRLGLGVVAAGFVLLWSTGFIGAKIGVADADPVTFLALRFWIVAAALGAWALATGARWPARRDLPALAAAGALIHALYLGGAYVAMDWGLPAGYAALIAALAPILTAAFAWALVGERLSARQWFGMALGFLGVALAVWRKIDLAEIDGIAAPLVSFLGAAAFALGVLLQQRRLAGASLVTGSAIQYFSAALVAGAAAVALEPMRVTWTPELIGALVWLSVALSIGAISLMFLLLRHGGASRVASLTFLVPGVVALIAWPVFGETLGALELLGLLVASAGVALVTLAPRRAAS